MTKPDRPASPTLFPELLRELLSFLLLILLFIPSLIIRLADLVTSAWLRKRGGVD